MELADWDGCNGFSRCLPLAAEQIIIGCKLYFLSTASMPVIIRKLDDDESTVFMVDSNIQREDLLPSEFSEHCFPSLPASLLQA